jgi:putative DNA primase/helicase
MPAVSVELLRELHPELVEAKRQIALAPAAGKLLAIQSQALRLAPLAVPKPDKVDTLMEAAEAHGLCRTTRQREDVEHVVGEGLAGRSAGVGYIPSPLTSSKGWDRRCGAPQRKQDGIASKRLVVQTASDITPVAVNWLWPGRLARGKTTLIGGDPGLGKSQLSTFIAATISHGGSWPCNEGSAPKGSVIVLCAEDGLADTIVPRLMAAGADCRKVRIVTAVVEKGESAGRRIFNLSKDLDALENLITETGDVGLVIIDPVDAYIGAGVDSHKNAAVRAVLEPISELADRLGTAILAITHFSKQPSGKAMYRFIGSIAHVGAARVAFAVIADPENEGRVLMLHAKNNLAPPQKGLAFRLEQRVVVEGVIGSSVHFESDYVSGTADEVLAAERDTDGRSDMDGAIDFLRILLADGPRKAESVQDEARAAGLLGEDQSIGQSKPFRSARKALGIKPYQPKGVKSGGWIWALPDRSDSSSRALSASDALPKKRASDVQRASDVVHQIPSRPSSSNNGSSDDFPDLPDFLRRAPIAATPDPDVGSDRDPPAAD